MQQKIIVKLIVKLLTSKFCLDLIILNSIFEEQTSYN